jgi:hypothetical protein
MSLLAPEFSVALGFDSAAVGGTVPRRITGQVLSQPLNADDAYKLVLIDRDTGQPIPTYPETDALSCWIWSGQDQQVLATPGITWIDTSAGMVEVAVLAADLASLGPGLYRLMAAVLHEGATLVFFDGSIDLTVAPGAAAAPAAYCTYQDMTLYAPQIAALHDPRVDLAGFLGERARSRTCTNEMCLDRYRPNHGRARRHVSADGTTAGPYLRWVSAGPGGAPTPSIEDIRDALDAGGLRVTDKIREANARTAAAIVFLNQPGNNNPYHQLGQFHLATAQVLMAEAVIEIDTDTDGVPDIRVGQDVTWLG